MAHLGLSTKSLAFGGGRHVFLRGVHIGRVDVGRTIGEFHSLDKFSRHIGTHTSIRSAAEHVARDVRRVDLPKPHVVKVIRPRKAIVTPRLSKMGFALRKY